jgi:hypothetical protein
LPRLAGERFAVRREGQPVLTACAH